MATSGKESPRLKEHVREMEKTRSADAWIAQGPEIQQMYSLNMPVSAIRTKIRQEFERHRYVAQLKTVDVLLFNSHQEFQVRIPQERAGRGGLEGRGLT